MRFDRDGLYGAPRLYITARTLGLRAHIGAEVSVGEFGSQVLPEPWQPHTVPERSVRLSLLCESQTGYRNLSQLITGYKLRQATRSKGIAIFGAVRERAEGLVCFTSCDEGPLAAALARGGMDESRRALNRFVQTFGRSSLYMEVQRHRIREQEARNQAAIVLTRELRLPLLATNGANMATLLEREVLNVLTVIRHKTSLDEAGLLLQQNTNRYLLGASDMARLFRDLPSSVAETWELSSRLQFVMKDMGYQFPL